MKIKEKVYFKISAILDILFAKSFTLNSIDKYGLKQEVKYNMDKTV